MVANDSNGSLDAGDSKNVRGSRAFNRSINSNGRKTSKKSSKANVNGRESRAKGAITNIQEDDDFVPGKYRLTRKAQVAGGDPTPSFMGATYASKGLHGLAK
jgi:hypothetical protein